MKSKKTFFTYIVLLSCFLLSLFITLTTSGGIEVTWIEIFSGFGLTFLLGGILFISGKFFFDRLKLISIRAWRTFLAAYFIFVVLFLAKIGDFLIVAKEGWLSLYKHPFVWLILATLIGHLVLFIRAPNINK